MHLPALLVAAVVGPWGMLVMYLKSYQGFNKKKKSPAGCLTCGFVDIGTVLAEQLGCCFAARALR